MIKCSTEHLEQPWLSDRNPQSRRRDIALVIVSINVARGRCLRRGGALDVVETVPIVRVIFQVRASHPCAARLATPTFPPPPSKRPLTPPFFIAQVMLKVEFGESVRLIGARLN